MCLCEISCPYILDVFSVIVYKIYIFICEVFDFDQINALYGLYNT
jgi:hypothetical protein